MVTVLLVKGEALGDAQLLDLPVQRNSALPGPPTPAGWAQRDRAREEAPAPSRSAGGSPVCVGVSAGRAW